MLSCWRIIPGARPSFDDLVKNLSKMLDNGVADRYITLNEPYTEWNKLNSDWITDNKDSTSAAKTTAQFIEDQLYFTNVSKSLPI